MNPALGGDHLDDLPTAQTRDRLDSSVATCLGLRAYRSGGVTNRYPPPTAKSDGSDTPVPLGEKEIEAMIRTAIAGAGTREASRNSEDTHMPTPPPEAEGPFPPTDTPVPTETPSHPPTPTPNPYAHITIDADLCFNVNLHDPALRRTYEVYDASSYILIRCFDVIGRTIGERCAMNTTNGLDATVRACIKRNAEAVKDYRPRSQLAPECHSIGLTTDEEFFECMRDTSNHDNDLRAVIAETKSTIREDGRHAPGPHGNHRAAMERDLDTLLSLPPASYDACEKQAGRVSSLSLVLYRTNDYSVPAAYGHRDVLVRGYVDRVVISCGRRSSPAIPAPMSRTTSSSTPSTTCRCWSGRRVLWIKPRRCRDGSCPMSLAPCDGFWSPAWDGGGNGSTCRCSGCCGPSPRRRSTAVGDAIRLGAVSFDAVKHLVLCQLEGRPPRLDLELYPYLPRVRVSTTSAKDYMTLLSRRAA